MAIYIKTKLKASYTVENSVILPIFFLIILALLYLNFYMHDKIIQKTVVTSMGVQYENINDEEISKQNLAKSQEYLSQRCIFFKLDGIKVQSKIDENYAPNMIRVLNALHKVVN